ncbi:FG-GAP-like repeat-containing protein [Hymenobacter sp. YC55]|uniref:FG-GAP-like repeat-containing protein n=1 Tax=Hymenobacter sp. YC55 TaxID=3034019 RepID=UPI0023F89D69|nr:FG-GAP-like repeat-containing protein [Hymenobacter sp. YC55]MDF7815693.1 FG-GAP-like repeat-containing protein [Hymenobacter sp. YC55]
MTPFFRGRRTRGALLMGLLVLPIMSLAQPTVMRASLAPAANAPAASRSTTVVVPFSQAIAPATAGTIRLFSSQYRGQRTATTSVSSNTVTLAPTAPTGSSAFRPGETVHVTIPSTVQSTGGTAATPYVYQFTAATTGGSGTFSGGSDLPISNQLTSVVLGDVDGDGDLDVILGNVGGSTVNVRLNNGRGTFGGGFDPGVTSDPRRVRLGDVDGDGDLDLLTVTPFLFTGTVSVRLNDGSGQFSGGTTLTGFYQPEDVVLGDVDGDGDLDLVVANYRDNSVDIRLNNGNGTFRDGSTLPVGSNPESVVLGDVDGDGDLDLVVANSAVLGTVSIRLNNGSGTFSGGTDLAVSSQPTAVTLGDVDGDSDLDLAVTDYSKGLIHIRLNNGSGLFSGGSSVPVATQPTGVLLGDVEGDGDLDLVVVNRAGSTSVNIRLNNGSGTFSGGSSPSIGLAALGLALGDIDGDGDLDLLTTDPINRSVTVRLNGGGPLPTRLATGTTALSLYPNPGRGRVQVTGLAPKAAVVVSDALGRPITTARATAGGVAYLTLPPSLAAGVYFVRSEGHSQRLSVE